jgi:hypothetical protein
VLADNLDPGNTKVSEVMTKDPYCIGVNRRGVPTPIGTLSY